MSKFASNAAIVSAILTHARKLAPSAPHVAEYLPILRKLKPSNLLVSNAKLDKSPESERPMLASLLNLSPHKLSGHDICASAGACSDICNMVHAGQRILAGSRARALFNTLWFFADRSSFLAQLRNDIRRQHYRALSLGVDCAIRLNGASDLDWTSLINEYSDTRSLYWYDYTKIRSRFERYLNRELPSNYFLTFSADERVDQKLYRSYLSRGGNLATVFAVDYYPNVGRIGRLPESVKYSGKRFAVVDGDRHDWRFPWHDGRGVVVGLRLKGAANATKELGRQSGFAQ